MSLNGLLKKYKRELRSFRTMLTDSEGLHVYPMRDPLNNQLRYVVCHFPAEWGSLEILKRVKLLLLVFAAEARSQKDIGVAAVIERCCVVIETVLRYHMAKAQP